MLCISPVAAVSADDFEIVVDRSNSIETYKYLNVNNPDELYIKIYTRGTCDVYSVVTFRPANIHGAPVMIVDTSYPTLIYLTQSVDDWEIMYYDYWWEMPSISGKTYLKNGGDINLKKYFGGTISEVLYLALHFEQSISTIYEVYKDGKFEIIKWYIPEV